MFFSIKGIANLFSQANTISHKVLRHFEYGEFNHPTHQGRVFIASRLLDYYFFIGNIAQNLYNSFTVVSTIVDFFSVILQKTVLHPRKPPHLITYYTPDNGRTQVG